MSSVGTKRSKEKKDKMTRASNSCVYYLVASNLRRGFRRKALGKLDSVVCNSEEIRVKRLRYSFPTSHNM